MVTQIVYPNIADEDLVFTEDETRKVLKFFCPSQSAAIDGMAVTNEARRMAQQAFIVAVDASYAMGYVDIIFTGAKEVITNDKLSGVDIKGLAKKLAKKAIKAWWKHITQKQLDVHAKIYDTVRTKISNDIAQPLAILIGEGAAALSMRKGMTLTHTAIAFSKRAAPGKVWV